MDLNAIEETASNSINKNIKYLSIATFLADIGGGLVNVVLPLFLISLGFDKTFVGTVEGLADFTAESYEYFQDGFLIS